MNADMAVGSVILVLALERGGGFGIGHFIPGQIAHVANRIRGWWTLELLLE